MSNDICKTDVNIKINGSGKNGKILKKDILLILGLCYFLLFSFTYFQNFVHATIYNPSDYYLYGDNVTLNLSYILPVNISYNWNNKNNITGCQNCLNYNSRYGEYDNISINNSLIFHFNENNGSIIYDNSKYKNHGSVNNAIFINNSIYAYALDFDGNGDYVIVPYDDSLNFSHEISINFWININGSTGGLQYIVAQGYNTANWKWAVLLNNANKIVFYVHNGTISKSKASLSSLNYNKWYHISTIYNNTNFTIFINSEYNGSTIPAISNGMNDILEDIIIGKKFTQNANYLNATIDELIIINKSITHEEVIEIYNNKTFDIGIYNFNIFNNSKILELKTFEVGKINTCDVVIDRPGSYQIVKNLNYISSHCIIIESNDVILDGNNYIINGTGSSNKNVIRIINVSYTYTNITIKNINTTNWATDINIYKVNDSFFINNTHSKYTDAYKIENSKYNLFENNIIETTSTGDAFLLTNINNNIFNNNTINLVSNTVFNINLNVKNNNFTNNTISGSYYLFFIQDENFENNLIYNNFINTTEHLVYDMGIGIYDNIYNKSLISGENIIGGNNLGGNFWAKLNGNGFSETCIDNDANYICDSSYMLASGNTDYLPLSNYILNLKCNLIYPLNASYYNSYVNITVELTTPYNNISYSLDDSFNYENISFSNNFTLKNLYRNEQHYLKIACYYNNTYKEDAVYFTVKESEKMIEIFSLSLILMLFIPFLIQQPLVKMISGGLLIFWGMNYDYIITSFEILFVVFVGVIQFLSGLRKYVVKGEIV